MKQSEALFEDPLAEYRRLTMEEIRGQPWNGLTAVGSFSGCGGSSLGLLMAGWHMRYAIEFIPIAAQTYAMNFPATRVDERDVRRIQGQEILDYLGLTRGELDLLEGSPPCASFSAAGTGRRTRDRACDVCGGTGQVSSLEEEHRTCERCDGTGRVGGEAKRYGVASGEDSVKQRTDDLFWEWARLLRDLYPRAFVAENVPGMLMGDALEDYARKITTMLGELGYRVSAQVINAAQYGAPQERRRLIFVGFRDDVRGGPFQFPPPTITRAVTLGQALDSVDPDDPDHAPYLEDSSMEPYAVGRTWKRLMEIRAHNGTPGNGWLDEGELAGEDCERCGKPLDREEFHEVLQRSNEGTIMKARCADGERAHIIKAYFTLCVPLRERPCPTLTATGASPGAASVTHPSECRKLTPAEAKAVCGFPPDFKLLGSRSQRYERMGRAVPPPVYDVIGREIARRLKEEY